MRFADGSRPCGSQDFRMRYRTRRRRVKSFLCRLRRLRSVAHNLYGRWRTRLRVRPRPRRTARFARSLLHHVRRRFSFSFGQPLHGHDVPFPSTRFIFNCRTNIRPPQRAALFWERRLGRRGDCSPERDHQMRCAIVFHADEHSWNRTEMLLPRSDDRLLSGRILSHRSRGHRAAYGLRKGDA